MNLREEVERAYGAARAIVTAGEFQHLYPYQLEGHLSRAQAGHLAELEKPPAEPVGDPDPAAPDERVQGIVNGPTVAKVAPADPKPKAHGKS